MSHIVPDRTAVFAADSYADDKQLDSSSESIVMSYRSFVDEQIADLSKYNLDANLDVLMDFLVSPDIIDIVVIRKILFLALLNVAESDFDLCLFQIPLELQQNDPGVEFLINCESLLKDCKFKEFWTFIAEFANSSQSENCKDLIPCIKSEYFVHAIQRFVSWCISLTFININSNDLKPLLAVESNEELLKFCERQNWLVKQKFDDNSYLIQIDSSDKLNQASDRGTETSCFQDEMLKKCLDALGFK